MSDDLEWSSSGDSDFLRDMHSKAVKATQEKRAQQEKTKRDKNRKQTP